MSIQAAILAKPAATGLITKAKKAAASGPASTPKKGKPPTDAVIRLAAYLKWEAAGKPDGNGVSFWLEAEKELLKAQ